MVKVKASKKGHDSIGVNEYKSKRGRTSSTKKVSPLKDKRATKIASKVEEKSKSSTDTNKVAEKVEEDEEVEGHQQVFLTPT